MEQPICKDPIFLSRASEPACPEDAAIGQDLRDTLLAHRADCVGLAANMIGRAKAIIVVDDWGKPLVMYNPEILKAAGPYEAQEGCLSLPGTRKTTRYNSIKVKYQNEDFQTRIRTFRDFTAQIIQHECDHLKGKLI